MDGSNYGSTADYQPSSDYQQQQDTNYGSADYQQQQEASYRTADYQQQQTDQQAGQHDIYTDPSSQQNPGGNAGGSQPVGVSFEVHSHGHSHHGGGHHHPQHRPPPPGPYRPAPASPQQPYPHSEYGTPTYPPAAAPSRPPPPSAYPYQQGYASTSSPQPPIYAPPSQFAPQHRPPPGPHSSPFSSVSPMGMLRPELGPPVPWTTDIFGFLQDCYGCPLVTLAPCVAFGQMAEVLDTGYTTCLTASLIYAGALLLGIPCLYSYTYRTKMRHHFNLRSDPMDDLCLHFWCECCALAQEYRELSYRGIDPSLGYAYQEQTITSAMKAPVAPRMAK